MFTERLVIDLTLLVGGKEHAISPGNVTACDLALESFGLSGAAEFWLPDDERAGGRARDDLFEAFRGQDLMEARLRVSAAHSAPETVPDIEPIAAAGIVRAKRVTETWYHRQMPDRPVLCRRYRVEFADPARVLWTQHHPCELYTGTTVARVIDAHKGDRIRTRYGWDALSAEREMIFLGLDHARGASFYDLLMWYVHTRAGVFAYDHAEGVYTITGEKEAGGRVAKLRADDIARIDIELPEVPRCEAEVLSSYTERPERRRVGRDQAVPGVLRDVLVRTPLAAEVGARARLEGARVVSRGPELAAAFQRFPTITLRPGVLVELDGGDLWSPGGLPVGEVWRARRIALSARALDDGPDAGSGADSAGYRVDLRAVFERRDEVYVDLPPFTPPRYPVSVEGRVVSDQGEDAEITYQFYPQERTGIDRYKVEIPLWGGQIVHAPYQPQQGAGIVYFPLYKRERVLVALSLEGAEIEALIDWRDGARLPLDTQGDHVLFGKTARSRTSIRHVYEQGAPVLAVDRVHESDRAEIRVEEGAARIRIHEVAGGGGAAPGTLVCTIALDKRGGITIEVEDEAARITQTVAMDGRTITIKAAGPAATSTVTQTPERVAVECKDFSVKADRITCESTISASHQSRGPMTLSSVAPLRLSSDAQLAAGAPVLNLQGRATATLQGANLVMSATAASLAAASVQINGGASVQINGGLASVRAGLVNIGTVVRLG